MKKEPNSGAMRVGTNVLSRFPIGAKIGGLVGLLILLLAVTGIVSLLNMKKNRRRTGRDRRA